MGKVVQVGAGRIPLLPGRAECAEALRCLASGVGRAAALVVPGMVDVDRRALVESAGTGFLLAGFGVGPAVAGGAAEYLDIADDTGLAVHGDAFKGNGFAEMKVGQAPGGRAHGHHRETVRGLTERVQKSEIRDQGSEVRSQESEKTV